jgi:hypothetical protein
LLPQLGLSKDAIHIYVGVVCLLVSVLVFRLPLSSWKALILGLIVAAIMESLDLRDDLASFGHFRWAASLKDLVNTNLIPLLIVLLAKKYLPLQSQDH